MPHHTSISARFHLRPTAFHVPWPGLGQEGHCSWPDAVGTTWAAPPTWLPATRPCEQCLCLGSANDTCEPRSFVKHNKQHQYTRPFSSPFSIFSNFKTVVEIACGAKSSPACVKAGSEVRRWRHAANNVGNEAGSNVWEGGSKIPAEHSALTLQCMQAWPPAQRCLHNATSTAQPAQCHYHNATSTMPPAQHCLHNATSTMPPAQRCLQLQLWHSTAKAQAVHFTSWHSLLGVLSSFKRSKHVLHVKQGKLAGLSHGLGQTQGAA